MSNSARRISDKVILPTVNIFETETAYIIEAMMPGVLKDNVEVKLDNNKLTILGKREESECSRCIVREIDDGSYYREFRTNAELDVKKIHASLENGILMVTLPKHERALPREIPIKMD